MGKIWKREEEKEEKKNERRKEGENLKVCTFEEDIDHGEIAQEKEWGKEKNGESSICTFSWWKGKEMMEKKVWQWPFGTSRKLLSSHRVMWRDGDLARAQKVGNVTSLMVATGELCKPNPKDCILWKPICFKTKTKVVTFYNLPPIPSPSSPFLP